jgi:heme/copper-type cytochrome/quinol oxidase subunit 3
MFAVKFHDVYLVKGSALSLLLSLSLFIFFSGLINLFETGLFIGGSNFITVLGLALCPLCIFCFFFEYQNEWDLGVYDRLEFSNVKLGFFLFIITEIMVFFSLFFTFFYFSFWASIENSIWPGQNLPVFSAVSLALPLTLLLLSSSGAVNTAISYLLCGEIHLVIVNMLIAIGCGISFLLLQIHEYKELVFGYTDGVAGSLFLSITGLHGLHVFLGLCFLGGCLVFLLFVSNFIPYRLYVFFEVSAWYWHFVDFVWLIVYCLLYERQFLYGLTFLDFYKVLEVFLY